MRQKVGIDEKVDSWAPPPALGSQVMPLPHPGRSREAYSPEQRVSRERSQGPGSQVVGRLLSGAMEGPLLQRLGDTRTEGPLHEPVRSQAS